MNVSRYFNTELEKLANDFELLSEIKTITNSLVRKLETKALLIRKTQSFAQISQKFIGKLKIQVRPDSQTLNEVSLRVEKLKETRKILKKEILYNQQLLEMQEKVFSFSQDYRRPGFSESNNSIDYFLKQRKNFEELDRLMKEKFRKIQRKVKEMQGKVSELKNAIECYKFLIGFSREIENDEHQTPDKLEKAKKQLKPKKDGKYSIKKTQNSEKQLKCVRFELEKPKVFVKNYEIPISLPFLNSSSIDESQLSLRQELKNSTEHQKSCSPQIFKTSKLNLPTEKSWEIKGKQMKEYRAKTILSPPPRFD